MATTRPIRRYVAAAVAIVAVFIIIGRAASPPKKPPYTTWSDYAGSADSMQYSALKEITRRNVSQLEQAWFYPTPGPNAAFNPVVLDGVMYALGPNRSIVAVDAATGKQIWAHPVEGNPAERGINYSSKDGVRSTPLQIKFGLEESASLFFELCESCPTILTSPEL